MNPLPNPVGDFIPHAPPMVFLDSVTAIGDDAVTAESVLNRDSFPGGGESAPGAWALEIAAQACAVFIGFSYRDRGYEGGRLIKAADLSFHAETIPYGRRLRVEARLTSATDLGFFVFETTLTGPDEHLLFQGRLSILAR